MRDDELQFDKFWEASSLNRHNVQLFASQLANYDSDNKDLLLEYPLKPNILTLPKSHLNTLSKKRTSNRKFSGKTLSKKDLSQILSSFHAWNGLEHRGYPSAGATYATEIFAVCFNVQEYSGDVLYYDPELHGVVVVTDTAPSWLEASKTLNMTISGEPNLLIVFVTFPERVSAKYGERGGRFALLEAGAAMQQLCLQLAEMKNLSGVAVGGMLDNDWKMHLKLAHTNAKITLGYLVGQQ